MVYHIDIEAILKHWAKEYGPPKDDIEATTRRAIVQARAEELIELIEAKINA